MPQAVTLPLWAARIADFGKGGKQRTKRHQDDSHQLRISLQQIRSPMVQLSTLRRAGSGRYGRTAWPWVVTRARACLMPKSLPSIAKYKMRESLSCHRVK